MTSPQKVLDIARNQLGTVESPPGSNSVHYNRWYYGKDERQPWCATFVSWVFFQAGLPIPATTSKGFAYTPSGAAFFKRNNKWRSNTGPCQPGDVVFFYWPNMGRIAHTGIVETVHADGTVTCIEGNTDSAGGRTGGRVMRQRRSRSTIHSNGGFGVPTWQSVEPPVRKEIDMQYTYYLDGRKYATDTVWKHHIDGPAADAWFTRLTNEGNIKHLGVFDKDSNGRAFHDSLEDADGLQAMLSEVLTRLKQGGGGTVDLDALAKKVADEISKRMQS